MGIGSPRVLFCGSLSSVTSKSLQRLETLKHLGVDAHAFNFDRYWPTDIVSRIHVRATRGRFPTNAVRQLEQALFDAASSVKPDVVWIEKCWMLKATALHRLKEATPAARFLSYQTDDPFGNRRRERPLWTEFLGSLPYYDAVFVIRQVNIEEFRSCGAVNVFLSRYGFHGSFAPRPLSDIPADCRHDVVFVGTPLDHRVRAIRRLLLKHRAPLHVYGSGWNRTAVYHLRRNRLHGETGDRYPLIISGSKISLGFVSSSNRDEYTERSVDIPACQGFFLAERTPKHQELYDEHREAEFFSSDEECADKIRFFLTNDAIRDRIAAAGSRRCRQSHYVMTKVVEDVLSTVRDC